MGMGHYGCAQRQIGTRVIGPYRQGQLGHWSKWAWGICPSGQIGTRKISTGLLPQINCLTDVGSKWPWQMDTGQLSTAANGHLHNRGKQQLEAPSLIGTRKTEAV